MKFQTVLLVISACWIISEIALSRLKRSGSGASALDKSSIRILWLTIIGSITLGMYFRVNGMGFIPSAYPVTAWVGLFLIVAGLAIRWIAIFTLKQFFTVDVTIKSNHKVVNTGLYKHIRHPSYTGSLISFLGLGLSFSNWLSTLVIFLPITAAFIYRISIEEKALTEFLGDAYVQYSTSTKRLVPKLY